jgi:hypothetical protein
MLLLVLVAAGLLAGCGGGGGVKEANSYVDAVNKAQTRFASTVDSLSAQITSTSTPAEDRATLGKFQGAVEQVVGDLRAVDPPDKVRDLHARLITAMKDFGEQVREVSSALSSGSATRLLAAQEQLAKATAEVSQKINATIAAINRKLSD